MNKTLTSACVIVLALSAAAQAHSAGDSIVYNQMGNEVGVIQGEADGGATFIVQPTQATLDLGYYDVAIPADTMRHRKVGGWVTALSNEQIAFLPPTDDRYFQPSGD